MGSQWWWWWDVGWRDLPLRAARLRQSIFSWVTSSACSHDCPLVCVARCIKVEQMTRREPRGDKLTAVKIPPVSGVLPPPSLLCAVLIFPTYTQVQPTKSPKWAKAKQVELRANEQKRQTKRRKERINGRRRVERAGEKKQLKLASSPWSWQDLWSHKMRG